MLDPSLSLEGQTALVTGANQGIGLAIARLLHLRGAFVAMNYPSENLKPELCGRNSIALRADVSSVTEIERMFGEAAVAFDGRLDILVNNAGVFPRADVLEMDEATWDKVLDTNAKGTFFCSQAAAALMIPRRSGSIVNISSGAALSAAANSAHYSASKAGIGAVTKGFARALAPHGIRVNAVAPGLTDTAQPRYGMTEDEIAAAAKSVPLGRIGQPEDIANVVLFLISGLSAYMTGQTLFVNGGSAMVP